MSRKKLIKQIIARYNGNLLWEKHRDIPLLTPRNLNHLPKIDLYLMLGFGPNDLFTHHISLDL